MKIIVEIVLCNEVYMLMSLIETAAFVALYSSYACAYVCYLVIIVCLNVAAY